MTYTRTHTEKRDWPDAHVIMAPPERDFAAGVAALALGIAALAPLAFDASLAPTLAALVVFAFSAVVTARALHREFPHDRLGLCNLVTLTRLAMTAALVAPLVMGAAASWSVFVVATVALSLDGVDGWLARRQGYVSGFGARFDMEVDSLLALVLALSAAVSSGLGPLTILLGLPRYAFAFAGWALPWMRRDLPDRFSRKAVCVVQLAALIALQAPILPNGLAMALVIGASAALVWSFAVDVRWLWRRRA